MENDLEKIEVEINKAENETSNNKEEVFEPKEEIFEPTEKALTTNEEVLTPKEDKTKRSLISAIKNLLSTNNKPIHLKEEAVLNNEKLVDEEKTNSEEETNNKITQTLDVLVEDIETRKQKTFVGKIFSFMLRPCSA
jgi:hypothetical protein